MVRSYNPSSFLGSLDGHSDQTTDADSPVPIPLCFRLRADGLPERRAVRVLCLIPDNSHDDNPVRRVPVRSV